MDSKHFLEGIFKFGVTKEEICLNTLGSTIAAVLSVSDNDMKEHKSLMVKRGEEERCYRRFAAREIIPQIIKESV